MNTETDKVIHVQRGNKSWKLHVIVSMLVLSAVGHKFEGQVKPRTLTLVFVGSLISMLH